MVSRARKPKADAAKPRAAVKFTQEAFDAICEAIADGRSVRETCEIEGMPDRTTFNKWRKSNDELQKQYDQACRDRELAIFDDIHYIADHEPDPKVAKVRIESREWTLARMNRKQYGNHVSNEHTGADGGPIKTVYLNNTPVEELPE